MDGAHESAKPPARAVITNTESDNAGGQDDRSDGRGPEVVQSSRQAASDSSLLEVFHRLFVDFYRSVRYFFSNRGFSSDECLDLTQETFLKAFKGYRGFRGEASERTWIFQIATNVWLNEIRRRHAAKRSAQEVSFEEAFDPGRPGNPKVEIEDGGQLTNVLADERADILRQALEDLPPQMRRCIFLRVDQDLKYREIADLMQLSIETVKSHLHQARQRLKESLSEYFEDPDSL